MVGGFPELLAGRTVLNVEISSKVMASNKDIEKTPYPADKARQGEIVLRTRSRRIIFAAGLVGLVALAVAMLFLLH